MDNHVFTIRLAGLHMNVTSLPLKDLAELLDLIHSLLAQSEEKELAAKGADPLQFSLVGVKESGSVSYMAVANDSQRGLVAYRNATNLLRRRHTDRAARKAAHRLQSFASKWNTPVECYAPNSDVPDVVVEANEIPESVKVQGTTTLYGTLDRVGGVEPKARLRTDQGSIVIDVDREFARTLGPKLYRTVGLVGMATWDAETWELLAFRAESLLDYEPVPYSQAFEELAEAGPRAWSKEYLDSIPGFVERGVNDT